VLRGGWKREQWERRGEDILPALSDLWPGISYLRSHSTNNRQGHGTSPAAVLCQGLLLITPHCNCKIRLWYFSVTWCHCFTLQSGPSLRSGRFILSPRIPLPADPHVTYSVWVEIETYDVGKITDSSSFTLVCSRWSPVKLLGSHTLQLWTKPRWFLKAGLAVANVRKPADKTTVV